MIEEQYRQTMTRAWLESWIENNEEPDWFDWFGMYPAKASVDAAKAQLTAMNEHGLVLSTAESFEIFRP